MNDDLLKDLTLLFSNSKLNKNDKKYLLKLKRIYLKNQFFIRSRFNTLDEVEKFLYGEKNSLDKVYFELERIKRNLYENLTNDEKSLKNLSLIFKILKFSVDNKLKNEELYNNILKEIVRIEIDLDMPIGLFVEFNEFLLDELERFKNIIDDDYYVEDNELATSLEKIKIKNQ